MKFTATESNFLIATWPGRCGGWGGNTTGPVKSIMTAGLGSLSERSGVTRSRTRPKPQGGAKLTPRSRPSQEQVPGPAPPSFITVLTSSFPNRVLPPVLLLQTRRAGVFHSILYATSPRILRLCRGSHASTEVGTTICRVPAFVV